MISPLSSPSPVISREAFSHFGSLLAEDLLPSFAWFSLPIEIRWDFSVLRFPPSQVRLCFSINSLFVSLIFPLPSLCVPLFARQGEFSYELTPRRIDPPLNALAASLPRSTRNPKRRIGLPQSAAPCIYKHFLSWEDESFLSHLARVLFSPLVGFPLVLPGNFSLFFFPPEETILAFLDIAKSSPRKSCFPRTLFSDIRNLKCSALFGK